MNIRVLLEYDPETQGYSATCPELNFVSSCGDTKEEAIEGLKEAVQLLLTPIPPHHQGKQIKLGTLKAIEKQAGIRFD